MLKIMVVEDIDLMRQDIIDMVDWESHGCRVVAQARNGRQGLDAYQKHRPDVVITDIRMPVMTGLEMIAGILRVNPAAQFILLTMYEEFEYAKTAVRYGVSSYILKDEISEALILEELGRIQKKLAEKRQADFWDNARSLRQFLENESAPAPKMLDFEGKAAAVQVGSANLTRPDCMDVLLEGLPP